MPRQLIGIKTIQDSYAKLITMGNNMTDGEQISHLVTMIHMEADSAHNSVVSETGYLNRLQKEIDGGGFASDGTLEIMMLEKSEKYLREMAERIELARLQLLSNSKKSKIRVINITGEQF